VTAVVALAVGVAPGAADARPKRPTSGQISAAQQAADAAAAQEGQLRGQLAQAQAALDDANAHAALALDQYEGKQEAYEKAVSKAKAAQAAADKAQADLADAKDDVAAFARDSYMSGSTSSRMTSLITSGSPSQMLERAALLDAVGDNRSQVLTTVTVVEKKARSASTSAKTAMTHAAVLEQQAATALKSAQAMRATAVAQQQTYQAQETAAQTTLKQARSTLTGLQGEKAAADRYDQQQAAAAAAAAAAAEEQAASDDSGSSSSGSSSSGSSSSGSSSGSSSAGSAGSSGSQAGPGSSSVAESAIRAAKRWIGTPYAWGGGSLTGPSRGFDDGMGNDDSNVIGFDCSGLTRYAYAQAGIYIQRQSTMQYLTLPHVARANLKRGDLVFWAFDTSNPYTIHHVAIYLGGNQIIEAPESGMTVRVTSMRWTGYIGAARPSA
jgi:cell wall-associated NlpC family hydrolase